MIGSAVALVLALACAGPHVDPPADTVFADTVPADAPAPASSLASSPASSPILPSSPGQRDPWLAEDKLQHFAMSFAATAFSYGGARFVLDPDPASIAAAAAAIGAGVGKEIRDARAGRWFSLRDMAWNLAGVGLGLVFVHHIR